jgi:perosamine synthetase
VKHIGVGTFKTTPRMAELVSEALLSSRISYGPMSQRFEREFAAIHDSRFAVLSNSGTSSLQVALQALKEIHGWADGDEVIVPALTFVATCNVVLHNRMKPVLVDVEPQHYGIDVNKLEAAITPRTRAIIPVHLFGMPCDMTSVMAIAQHHGLSVIEDSCECMFVNHAGKKAGAWGDIGCFSTYVAHLLTTGVGGLATTNNPDYAAKMRSLVNHGRDGIYISMDDGRGATGEELKEVISRRFRFESVGHSFRITEMEAALGVAQLETWQEMIMARYQNAIHLMEALAHCSQWLQLPSLRPNTGHAFMMFPLVLRYEESSRLTAWLEEHGIETRGMLPLTNQPVYQAWCNEDDFPVAKWINDSGFYIGCHQDLTPDDLDYMAETIQAYFGRQRIGQAAD